MVDDSHFDFHEANLTLILSNKLRMKSLFLWILPSLSPKYFLGMSTFFSIKNATKLSVHLNFFWRAKKEFKFSEVDLETREREKSYKESFKRSACLNKSIEENEAVISKTKMIYKRYVFKNFNIMNKSIRLSLLEYERKNVHTKNKEIMGEKVLWPRP